MCIRAPSKFPCAIAAKCTFNCPLRRPSVRTHKLCLQGTRLIYFAPFLLSHSARAYYVWAAHIMCERRTAGFFLYSDAFFKRARFSALAPFSHFHGTQGSALGLDCANASIKSEREWVPWRPPVISKGVVHAIKLALCVDAMTSFYVIVWPSFVPHHVPNRGLRVDWAAWLVCARLPGLCVFSLLWECNRSICSNWDTCDLTWRI